MVPLQVIAWMTSKLKPDSDLLNLLLPSECHGQYERLNFAGHALPPDIVMLYFVAQEFDSTRTHSVSLRL